jgi:hypothetical protein
MTINFNATARNITFKENDGDKSFDFEWNITSSDLPCVFKDKFSTEDEHKGVYQHPSDKNFPDIDSLVYPLAVFQVTVSLKHPFVQSRGSKNISKEVKWKYPGSKHPAFIYVVPASVYDKFKYQHPLKVDGTRVKSHWNIQQYALKFDIDDKFKDSVLKHLENLISPCSKQDDDEDREETTEPNANNLASELGNLNIKDKE